jgi:hypothetical protein
MTSRIFELRALEPAPDLLAAARALVREAGGASPIDRALIAAAVSRANRCPPGADNRVTRLGEQEPAAAARPRHAELTAWAEASRNPVRTRWSSPYGPEMTAALLASHFLSRIAAALPHPEPLPAPPRHPEPLPTPQPLPTASVPAGDAYAASVPAGDAYAASVPAGEAYGALRIAALKGGDLLSEDARDTVAATVRWEDGEHPARPAEWAAELVQDLPGSDRVGTRIALLAAFAPAALGRGDVALWRLFHPAEADLVRLVAYGAVAATDHVARALAPAHR